MASDVLPGDDEGVDPATAYLFPTFGPQRLVDDGLVAFRQGNDNDVLVPDLAESIPIPADGGRTYTFTLRRGVRYSTGATVIVSDFVRGVERALRGNGGNPHFFAGILGGQACIDRPLRCDLSRGVVVDDAARSITFHLAAPDPEFLPKFTTFVFPTPPGTPMRAWTTVDRAVTDDAAVVPGVTWQDWHFVSARVGNYQSSTIIGPVLGQLWVR